MMQIPWNANRKSIIREQHAALLDALIDAVIGEGHLLTPQRLRVIYGICALGHVDNAEELWLLLNSKEKISRATVYNCLNILCQTGHLTKVNRDESGETQGRYFLTSLNPRK